MATATKTTKSTRRVLLPDSKLRKQWDLFVIPLILYSVLVIPYEIAFLPTSVALLALGYVVDFLFFVDISVNFFTAYTDSDENIVQDRAKIAKHYLRSWFALDFLATFPLDPIAGALFPGMANRTLQLLGLLRMLKLGRLLKLSRVLSGLLAKSEVNPSVVRLLLVMARVLYIGHFSACFWFLIGKLQWEAGYSSWLTRYGVQDADQPTLYCCSLYWAIATMTGVGYGDVAAATSAERLYSIVVMLVGAGMFGFIIGNIATLLETLDAPGAAFTRKLSQVKEYMRERRLPKLLQARILRHFKYYLKRKSLFDEQRILGELSPNLRTQVVEESNRAVIQNIPFLANEDSGFVTAIVRLLQPLFVYPGEVFLQEGDIAKQMFFLLRGRVEAARAAVGAGGTDVIVGVFTDGAYFGDVSCLKHIAATYTLRAASPCDMYALPKEGLDKVLGFFHGPRQRMMAAVDRKERHLAMAEASQLGAGASDRAHLVHPTGALLGRTGREAPVVRRGRSTLVLVDNKLKTHKSYDYTGVGEVLPLSPDTPARHAAKGGGGAWASVTNAATVAAAAATATDQGDAEVEARAKAEADGGLASETGSPAAEAAASQGAAPPPAAASAEDGSAQQAAPGSTDGGGAGNGDAGRGLRIQVEQGPGDDSVVPTGRTPPPRSAAAANSRSPKQGRSSGGGSQTPPPRPPQTPHLAGLASPYGTVASSDGVVALTTWQHLTHVFRSPIEPEGWQRQRWDPLLGIAIVYSALMVPYQLGFGQEPDGWALACDVFIDVVFVVDIFVNFRTGYVDRFASGLVMEPRAVALHYLRTWFTIDFLSTMPFDRALVAVAMVSGSADTQGTTSAAAKLAALRGLKSIRFLRLTRLLKLLRVMKLSRSWARLEEYLEISPAITRVFRLLFHVSFVAHVLACFWFFVALSGEEGANNWWRAVGMVPTDTPIRLASGAVVMSDSGGVSTVGATEHYVAAVYWAFTTMTTVGYGDILAVTNAERLYASFSMMLGASMFGYIIGSLASLVGKMDVGAAMRKDRMDHVRSYMRERKLCRDTQRKVLRYYSFYHTRRSVFDEEAILSEMSQTLRQEVVLFLNRDILRNIPFLADRSDDTRFTTHFMSLLTPSHVVPGDLVYRQGEIGLEMYFLVKGSVVAVTGVDTHAEKQIRFIDEGGHFGEIALLMSIRRPVSTRAIKYCSLFVLTKLALDTTLTHYPTLAATLTTHLMAILRQEFALASQEYAQTYGAAALSALRSGRALPPGTDTTLATPTAAAAAASSANSHRPSSRWQGVGLLVRLRAEGKDGSSSDSGGSGGGGGAVTLAQRLRETGSTASPRHGNGSGGEAKQALRSSNLSPTRPLSSHSSAGGGAWGLNLTSSPRSAADTPASNGSGAQTPAAAAYLVGGEGGSGSSNVGAGAGQWGLKRGASSMSLIAAAAAAGEVAGGGGDSSDPNLIPATSPTAEAEALPFATPATASATTSVSSSGHPPPATSAATTDADTEALDAAPVAAATTGVAATPPRLNPLRRTVARSSPRVAPL